MRGGAVNYLDLFSGIGGFHLGLKMAGFKFDKVFYSEIDDYANKVYAKNFPDAIPLGDITKINPAYLVSKIDIVTGGFPCQDISVAGKQKGITGDRSSLFHEIIRLCSVLRPRIMFLENVPNLITGESGLWFKTVMESIASIGYDAEWQIISAADVGALHLRKRIWLVAYPRHGRGRGAFRNTEQLRCSEQPKKTIRDATHPTITGSSKKHKTMAYSECDSEKWEKSKDGKRGGIVLYGQGRGKEDMADTNIRGHRGNRSQRKSRGKKSQNNSVLFNGATQWEVEPNVGRRSDGLPLWIYRNSGGLGYEESERTREILRELWNENVEKTLQHTIGKFNQLQRTEILFTIVCKYKTNINKARLLLEGEEALKGEVRSLWDNGKITGSPHRPRNKKQFSDKHTDSMQDLSRLLAHSGETNWQISSWEDGIPRVAENIPSRVDRLKGLGNAVVPQVVQLIGEMIKESGLLE